MTGLKLVEGKGQGELKDLYDLGEVPPLGHVPKNMHAWTIRKERHGPPDTAMQLEVVPTWQLDSHDVLVYVMAAGVNYNGVWAALGEPISPLDGHKQPFHIAGSDASGIVWAVGSKVKRWKVGDEVIIHCNQDDGDDGQEAHYEHFRLASHVSSLTAHAMACPGVRNRGGMSPGRHLRPRMRSPSLLCGTQPPNTDHVTTISSGVMR